jgi:hypothetical protein
MKKDIKQYQEDIKAGVDVGGVSPTLTQLKDEMLKDVNGLVLPEKWSVYAKENFPKENLEKQTIKNQGWNNCLEAVKNIISYHLQETYEVDHETMHGWCCACPYDQIEFNHRLEVQKAEMLSTIKGVGLEKGIDLFTIARVLDKFR